MHKINFTSETCKTKKVSIVLLPEMSTKSKILKGAEELVFKYGIKNITMDDIAKHLSISKKTIYKYFKEKEEIVHSLMKYSIEEDKRCFCNVRDNSKNVVEEVFEMMKYMREIFGKLNPIVFYELQRFYPETWNLFQEFKYGFIMNMIEESLLKGQKEGYIRMDINVKLLSRLRVETIELTLTGQLIGQEKLNMGDAQIAITEHFLYGVCTLKGHRLINKYKNIEEE